MLELKPTCEQCNKVLPYNATDAMICSYECTFCAQCVQEVLHNVCPNCGGGFVPRPIRPKEKLTKDPASTKVIHKHADMAAFRKLLDKYQSVPPEER